MSVIKLIGVFLLSIFITSSAYAECGLEHAMGGPGTGKPGFKKGPPMFPRPYFYLHNAEALGLSAEQVKKLKNVIGDNKKGRIRDEADLKVARMELNELIENGGDTKQVEKKIDEIAEIRKELLSKRVNMKLEARNILTQEQREKAKALMKDMKHFKKGEKWKKGDDCPLPDCPMEKQMKKGAI